MLDKLFNQTVPYSPNSSCRILNNLCVGEPYLILYRRPTVDVIVRKSRLAKLANKGSALARRLYAPVSAESYGLGICIAKHSAFTVSKVILRARLLSENVDSSFFIFSPGVRMVRTFRLPQFRRTRAKLYFLKASVIK